jgi:acetoin utilization deacetylase AcuC-like enzyme/GNAT superfamily N-acetyltransferase
MDARAREERQMIAIRRVYDDILPGDRTAIAAAQEILTAQFPGIDPRDVHGLADKLRHRATHGFRAILYVAESARGTMRAFALVYHEADQGFLYLDYIAARPGRTGGGVGGALYDRIRADARELGCYGIFFECLPDDPALSPDAKLRRQNAARLRFYEGFGARPVIGTAYETPITPGDADPPYLVFDALGGTRPLRRRAARAAVRAILERKYHHVCPPEYVDRVVASFVDDPVALRPPKYGSESSAPPPPLPDGSRPERRIVLVVNDLHSIHHVRERGYVEAPVRIAAILRQLEPTGLFETRPARGFPDRHILELHDAGWVRYFQRVCERIGPDRSVYPYVFPIRNAARPPKELEVRAGYYCIDTFTPLSKNAYLAARHAVDCTLTAAQAMLDGRRLAYSLVRPPGHHAERRAYGGFCYFNSAAIAAQYLSRHVRVAILDIDYHHGNGQQDIFWERSDVLTISIHGHPNFAYPYFSGFAEEVGGDSGTGFNRNYPLPESVDGESYRKTLHRALSRVQKHGTEVLVVALGFDTGSNDPTGTWSLRADDFTANGRLIGELGLPVLVVQEGGYRVRNLGVNARRFFTGLWQGAFRPGNRTTKPHSPLARAVTSKA